MIAFTKEQLSEVMCKHAEKEWKSIKNRHISTSNKLQYAHSETTSTTMFTLAFRRSENRRLI